MHLRCGRALKEMTRPSGTSASSTQRSTQSPQALSTQAPAPTVGVNVSTAMGATMAMPVST